MKGLEISEVKLSDVLNGVETFRLDAEYHAKEYETIENYIKNNPAKFSKFSNWNVGIDCSAFYPGVEPLYGTGDIPLIRVQNVKEEIEYDKCVTLPILPPEYETLKYVDPGDIVITKGGSIGFVGYVTKRAYASRDLMFINSSQLNERERVFLYLYLSTNFSFKQLIRTSSQCAQPHLTITLVKNFDVLLPSEELKDKCLSLFKESFEKRSQSKLLFTEAEQLLYRELGISSWRPDNTSINIKNLKESYYASGRLDAEYYMVKNYELESLIKSVSHKTIGEMQQFNSRGVQPDYIQNGEVAVVNSKHILEDGLDYDNFEHTTPAFLNSYLRARIVYGDILIYTTGANIGRTQVYLKDEPALASNHVNILRVKGVNPTYLALVLNSQVGRLQTEKLCTGSAQAELYPDDIEKIIVPILPDKVQQTIAEYIQRSMSLRNEAKQLLEDAKLIVEKAITV